MPAPLISVHPASRRVTLGGNATIFCKTPFLAQGSALSSLHSHLQKDGPHWIMSAKAHHGMASFRITSVRREYGGAYACYSSSDGAQSSRSESLELLVIGKRPSSRYCSRAVTTWLVSVNLFEPLVCKKEASRKLRCKRSICTDGASASRGMAEMQQ